MAGLGWKKWTRERLTSPEVQGYLMDQAVMAFDSAQQRAAELVAPTSGMVTYLADADRYEGYSKEGAWVRLGRFLGNLSSYPAYPGIGDFFYSIPHQCHLIRTGSSVAWQQLETPSVNGRAGVDALYNAVVAAGMTIPDGFTAYAYGLERRYMWDRSAWQLVGGRPNTELVGTAAFTAAAEWRVEPGSTLRANGDGTATARVQVTRIGAAFTTDSRGSVGSGIVVASVAAWYEALDWAGFGTAGGTPAMGSLSPGSGAVTLRWVAPAGSVLTVDTGQVFALSAMYRLYHAAGMPV